MEILVEERLADRPNLQGERLSTLAPRYDVVLCDVWGVIHNGMTVYAEAARALELFRAQGGCVILVSNASRLAPMIATHLDKLKFPRTAYDALVTSGDIARDYIAHRPDCSVFDVGPGDARPILEGLTIRFTSLHEADIALTSGAFGDHSLDDLNTVLAKMRAKDLPLLCANPDIVTELGGRRVQCSGAVGQRYGELGGRVTYAGKPEAPIYAHSLAVAAELCRRPASRGRVLVIGDSLGTDVAGAAAHGFDSLFIWGGIHAAQLGSSPTRASVDELLDQFDLVPTALAQRLVW
jgi:HAD superfamily hydrolase (TIGR01459 family)